MSSLDDELDAVMAERINNHPVAEEPTGESKKSAALLLVELARERYRFGVTESGDTFAVGAGRHVVRMLRGGRQSLRAELAKRYAREQGRVPAQQALADAMLVVEGEAQDADPERVDLRIADHGDAMWLDLGDVSESVVRITRDGWDVVDAAPVLFQRTALTGTLPRPERGGTLTELWELVNVATADRPLVLAWLVAAVVGVEIPHPILAVFGEQGTGKSTCSRMLVQLVDPSPVPLRKPPRDADGWVTAAAGSWVVGLDNLSVVPDWLSDSLCRASTGDGDVRRQLYTDGGLAVFAFRRVLLLNGIDVGAMRGDLAERLVTVTLDRISDADRLTETQLDRTWREQYPRLLGALLDLASEVIKASPSVRLGSSPRMADFAVILAAVDQVLDTRGLDRYAEQSKTIAQDSLDSDPFLAELRTSLAAAFMGTAAQLLSQITPGEAWRPPRDWPKNARQVTSRLRRNAPALRKAGWLVEDQGAANHEHATTWQVIPPDHPEKARNPSSRSSLPRAEAESGPDGARNREQPTPSEPRATSPTSHGLTLNREVARNARKDYGQSQDDCATSPAECDNTNCRVFNACVKTGIAERKTA